MFPRHQGEIAASVGMEKDRANSGSLALNSIVNLVVVLILRTGNLFQ